MRRQTLGRNVEMLVMDQIWFWEIVVKEVGSTDPIYQGFEDNLTDIDGILKEIAGKIALTAEETDKARTLLAA